MPASRSLILASLRRSLAAARLPEPPAAPRLPPSLVPRLPLLIEQFRAELETLGGLFIAERVDTAAVRVAELIRERSAAEIVAWQAESLPAPGLLDHLRRERIKIVGAEVPPEDPARSHSLAQVERIAIGLTGADAALADTGTLALRSGPGRPRLASLSVQTHIALFTPDQLHESWEAWWRAMPSRAAWVSEASSVSLISGPSRTADIEMTLTVGVHGPGEVIAILVQ